MKSLVTIIVVPRKSVYIVWGKCLSSVDLDLILGYCHIKVSDS